MTEAISTVVEHINALFPDTRLQHCRLQLDDTGSDSLALSGAVLDQATLDRAQQEAAARLPGVQWTFRA